MPRLLYLLIGAACSFPHTSFSQSLSDWSGSFEGLILGVNATLTGTLSGDQWTGTINVSGYPIQLEGTVIDMQCTGNMTDPQTDTAIPFSAKYLAKQIIINIRDINPISGLEENMELVFAKTTSQELIGTAINKSLTLDDPGSSNRDPSLIGLWRYTDTYVSGEYSFATDYFIQFKANGMILVTDGRTAGGGPTSSLDSGDGDTHHGIWKTENKTVWTKDESGQWQSYARYYVESNSMMLTYGNGQKQVWEKL